MEKKCCDIGMQPLSKPITICLDFDGVIRDEQTDNPVNGALKAIKWLEDKGREVVICTAGDIDKANWWLEKHNFNKTATNIKPKATAYIDNRAIRFVSWDDVCNYF